MSTFGQEHAQEETQQQKAQRGRPKKKPGYCRDLEINKLVELAASLYAIPYDDRDERPEEAPSILSVAEKMDASPTRVRKLLITADFYSTAISRKVQELAENGLTKAEIAAETGLCESSVAGYLPYSKGAYHLKDPTLYSEQCKLFRQRRKVCADLKKHPEDEQYLWEAIKTFEGYSFVQPWSEDMIKFQYQVRGEKICIEDVEFSREAINRAYRKARKIQMAEGCVDRCERLRCIGACELYTVFLRLGAIRAEKS